jgi:hypothetical protein
MRADIFINKTEGGGVEILVVQHGLSSGAAHKYRAFGEAEAVLLALGFHAELVDRQLRALSDTPPSVLLRFPEAEIADVILRSLGFTAAAFHAA